MSNYGKATHESPDFRGAYSRFKEKYETKGKDLEEILRDFSDWQNRSGGNTTLQSRQIELQHTREITGVYARDYISKSGNVYTRYRDIITGKLISINEVQKDKLDIITYEEWKQRKEKDV